MKTNKTNTLSERVKNQSSEQTNNNNPNNGDIKMTRQQRRKMEREMKKMNNKRSSSGTPKGTLLNSVLGFSITDFNTMNTYGSVPRLDNHSVIIRTQIKSSPVYQSILLMDVENNGVSSPSIVRLIHNVEKGMFDEKVVEELLYSVLSSYINSPNNSTKKTLNNQTRFTPQMNVSSELDPSVLEMFSEYLNKSSIEDVETLTSMITEFRKTG